MTSFAVLEKENDPSFDISMLDNIPSNSIATLDSLETTISFLTENIQHTQDTEQLANSEPEKPKRFAVPLSDKQIESISTKFVPKKTADSTKWAFRIFSDWVEERNRCPSALTECPADLFDY